MDLFVVFIIGVAVLSSVLGFSAAREYDQKIVRACVAKERDLCADAICGGDLEFDGVIQATGDAIEACLEQPKYIGEEYLK